MHDRHAQHPSIPVDHALQIAGGQTEMMQPRVDNGLGVQVCSPSVLWRASARLVASCQGSTLSRASAERTLKPVPFRSEPIGAQMASNSGPTRSARAGWITATPDPFF